MHILNVTAEPNKERDDINYNVTLSPETEAQFTNEKYVKYLKNKVVEAFVSAIMLNDSGAEVPEDTPLLIGFEFRRSSKDEEELSVLCKEGPEMSELKENIHPIRSQKIEGDFVEAVAKAFNCYYSDLYQERQTTEEILQNEQKTEEKIR